MQAINIHYIQMTDEQYEQVFSEKDFAELTNFMSHTKPQSQQIIEWHLASIENTPIGSVWMEHREDKIYFGLFILKEFRCLGYGRLALEHIIITSKQKGFKNIYLNVRESNINAIKLYESYGFSKVKQFTNNLGLSALEYVLAMENLKT